MTAPVTERCQGRHYTIPSILHFLPSNHDGHRSSRFFFTVRSASSLNSPLHSLTHYNIIMMMIEGECWLRSRIGMVHFRSAPRSIPNRRHTHNKTATRRCWWWLCDRTRLAGLGLLFMNGEWWGRPGRYERQEYVDRVDQEEQQRKRTSFPLIHHHSPRTSFRFWFWQLC